MSDDDMGGVDNDFDSGLEPMNEDIGSPMNEEPASSSEPSSSTPTRTSEQPMSTDTDQAEIEPSIVAPRVAIGTKESREPITTQIDPERKEDIDELVNELRSQYEPTPKKMDVMASIVYAGLPKGANDFHDHLDEFGYTRV